MLLKSIFIEPRKRGMNYTPRELSWSENIHETLQGAPRSGTRASEMTCQRPDAHGREETQHQLVSRHQAITGCWFEIMF